MTAQHHGQEELEAQFEQWRQYVLRRRELQPSTPTSSRTTCAAPSTNSSRPA
jgi:hypothetical protein